ncbi:fructokinase [Cnuella takakiae]|uniref:Fructokinase n=2 Tax=Cnuella takakiae TaxID=1302690 RepID=A0A1M4SVB0_9BACT|nr:fructokinase [Cnuella takakiae]
MNVAYHLKRLGENPTLISRVGTDERGRKLLALLDDSGIPTQLVQTDISVETGWVHARPKSPDEMEYDIIQPVAWDFIQHDPTAAMAVANATYFVFGSLATRNAVSRTTLYQLMEAASCRVLDINLRPPHYNRAGVEFLLSNADILKLNEAELELIARWYAPLQEHEDMMLCLQDKFNIPTIIVTLGSKGAMVLHQGSFYHHNGISVQVADTIGSGDAFLAGFLHKTIHGAGTGEALQFACGLGAFIATQNGACPNYNPETVQSMIQANSQSALLKTKPQL